MPKFAISLHSDNVVLQWKGRPKMGGLFCRRCVEADDQESAIPLAVQKLQRDGRFQELVLNPPDSPPRFAVDEVIELEETEDLEKGDSACIFYVGEEE